MNTQQPAHIMPSFDGVWMMDDTNTQAAQGISGKHVLDAATARGILANPGAYPYRAVQQTNGTPYFEAIEQDASGQRRLLRHYLFADPHNMEDVNSTMDWVFTVSRADGVISVLPYEIRRAPGADFVGSVRYGDVRTVVYSDTRQSGQVFLNVSATDAAARPAVRQAWRNLQTTVLDNEGMAAMAHMVLDMTGKCGHNHALHLKRPDHSRKTGWKGTQFRCE